MPRKNSGSAKKAATPKKPKPRRIGRDDTQMESVTPRVAPRPEAAESSDGETNAS